MALHAVMATCLAAGACSHTKGDTQREAKPIPSSTEPASASTWLGEPDAATAALASAAGNDVAVLLLLRSAAWQPLQQTLARLGGENGPLRASSMVEFLHHALKRWNRDLTVLPVASDGWDFTRPIALALVAPPEAGPMAAAAAVIAAGLPRPIHLRMLFPAKDVAKLAGAVAAALEANRRASKAGGDRYLVDGSNGSRTAVQIVEGDGHVRLELVHFDAIEESHVFRRAEVGPTLWAALDRDLAALRPPAVAPAHDLGMRLLHGARGLLTARVDLDAAVRFLVGHAMGRAVAAETVVDPSMRKMIIAESMSTWLTGGALMSGSPAEAEDITFAVDVDRGIEVAWASTLTPSGRRVWREATAGNLQPMPPASSAALFGMTVSLDWARLTKSAEPWFSGGDGKLDMQDMLNRLEEAGVLGWLALMAQPGAAWRAFWQSGNEASRAHLGGEVLPNGVAIELFGLGVESAKLRPSLRVTTRFPQHDPMVPKLAALVGPMLKQTGVPDASVEHGRRPDGDVLVVSVDPPGTPSVTGSARAQAAAPAMLARFFGRPADLAAQMGARSGKSRGIREVPEGLLALLRQIRSLDGSLQVGPRQLAGTFVLALTGQPEWKTLQLPVEPAAVGSEEEAGRASAGQLCLARAIDDFYRFMCVVAAVSLDDKLALFDQNMEDHHTDLQCAMADSASSAEATAFDSLVRYTRNLFVKGQARSEARRDEERSDTSPRPKARGRRARHR